MRTNPESKLVPDNGIRALTTQYYALNKDIETSTEYCLSLGTGFLFYEKAFDSVDPSQYPIHFEK